MTTKTKVLACEFYHIVGIDDFMKSVLKFWKDNPTLEGRTVGTITAEDPIALFGLRPVKNGFYATLIRIKSDSSATVLTAGGDFEQLKLENGNRLADYLTMYYSDDTKVMALQVSSNIVSKKKVEMFFKRALLANNFQAKLIPGKTAIEKLERAGKLKEFSLELAAPHPMSLMFEDSPSIARDIAKVLSDYTSVNVHDVENFCAGSIVITFKRAKTRNSTLSISKIISSAKLLKANKNPELLNASAKADFRNDLSDGNRDELVRLLDVTCTSKIEVHLPEKLILKNDDFFEPFYIGLQRLYSDNSEFIVKYVHGKTKKL